MRLEDYWGVGPKTRETLDAELGTEAAIAAIEGADVRTLVEAGIPRGRATRILRRAIGGAGLDVLATGDSRSVYKDLLDLAVDHAVTRDAADRLRVLTPLATREAMEERLDAVLAARDAWTATDEATRERVLDAFADYDEAGGGERPAVAAALALREADLTDGPFAALADLDPDALADAATALGALADGRVREGADDELDRLREAATAVEGMAADATGLVDGLREGGVRDTTDFREALQRHLTSETRVDIERVREAMPGDAADATGFVTETLRSLSADLRAAADERETAVREDLESDVDDAREDVDAAVDAVDDIAFYLSLARFAEAHDLHRPTFADADVLLVEAARNLDLAARGEAVQPVTYALGDHDRETPGHERVSVLTGANSGGKTTLLETLAQVVLLAQMGLPVPAERAVLRPFDAVVFHRRHASFNAGVLESTLRSIVPPLVDGDRTLMLVDEFEAITEPGSAADLLHGLVQLTVDQDALGTFVTHLADDLEPLPDAARTDGIFAEGLDADLQLQVDYQPRFDEVGRSTPEFIVSRLVANAGERAERAGFETLARAVGQEAVQRTLADARWSE